MSRIDPRRTRAAPTASRVALCVLVVRLVVDPMAYGGRREEGWMNAMNDVHADDVHDDDDRGRRRDGTRLRSSEIIEIARRAWTVVAVDALVRPVGKGGAQDGDSETADQADARRARREPTPRETVDEIRARAREAFEEENVSPSECERLASWSVARFVDEVLEVANSLEDLEMFFEDARAAAANVRAEGRQNAIGFEPRSVDQWSAVGMFLKSCYLGYNLLPFEATIELLNRVGEYADAAARARDGEPPDEDESKFRTCAAPEVLTAIVNRAIEQSETRSVRVDAEVPPELVEELGELAPELPTLDYLRHVEALRRRDYPAAVEHLHRHFDVNGEHDALRAGVGIDETIGGFESIDSGRERLQTALLALGSTQLEFSHVDQAVCAISEAVRAAQQNGDEGALAHALALTTALMTYAPVEMSRNPHYRDNELPTLLRRCASQAAEMASPHLIAYSTLALTKYAIDHPESVSEPSRSVSSSMMSLVRRDDAEATPLLATQSLINVELARHHSQLAASTPASNATMDAIAEANGDVSVSTASDLYPAPKGFSSVPSSEYTLGASAMALSNLTGTAASLAAEGWSAYGCNYLAKSYALRQLHLDVDASADDTAKCCAELLAHAIECEGTEAASVVRDEIERIFGEGGKSNRIAAAAILKLRYEDAIGNKSYAEARDAVRKLRLLVHTKVSVDDPLYFESKRLNANIDRLQGNFDGAHKALHELIEKAESANNAREAMWTKLALADVHLSARAASLAMMRALQLELEASELSLEPLRNMALCTALECWLELGYSHAQLARDTLDEHSLSLFASESLRVQARAYVICGRALVETTPQADLPSVSARVIDAYERAGARFAKIGAKCDAATAYARLAEFFHRMNDVASRDVAAARCRAAHPHGSLNRARR
jgi:anaphase-promoting complex subunit 5